MTARKDWRKKVLYMQNLVFVLSRIKRTDKIIAFIEAHATVHIPVEKNPPTLKVSSLGIFTGQRSANRKKNL